MVLNFYLIAMSDNGSSACQDFDGLDFGFVNV